MTLIIQSIVDDRKRTLFTVRLVEPIERTANRLGADLALHYVRWRITHTLHGSSPRVTL